MVSSFQNEKRQKERKNMITNSKKYKSKENKMFRRLQFTRRLGRN